MLQSKPKLTLFLFIILSYSIILNQPAVGFTTEDTNKDCAKCHSISTDDAKESLSKILPNVKVLNVQMAPVKGLWEIMFEDRNNQKGITYVSFSKRHVVAGLIVDLESKENLTRTRLIEENRTDISQIPLDDALIIGEPASPHKVIVFDDPDCPFCARFHQEIKKIIEKRKDIGFYVILYPLTSIHKDAYRKSKSIQCEKSTELLEKAFKREEIPDPNCETDIIDKNMEIGRKLGINSTPTIIFEDGRMTSGFMSADQLLTLARLK